MRSADGGNGGVVSGDGTNGGHDRVTPRPLSRRTLLRAGALVAVAGPLVAACTGQPKAAPPDPLQPMLNAATGDAAAAKAAATAFADNGATLAVIAAVRRAQAAALRAEVNRAAGAPPSQAAPTTSAVKPPTDEATVTARLIAGLATAQHQAAALMPTLPRYRAGLVGSVAAGCASLAEALHSTPITVTTATSTPAAPGGSATLSGAPAPSDTAQPPDSSGSAPSAGPTARLAVDTATALQDALSSAHAALWLYGTASAFVSGSVEAEIVAAMDAVQNLRDATQQQLTAGGVTPRPAQPAYLVPTPVSNQRTALSALATAESDATVAWRSVLEHTDDRALRAAALAALIDSAVRQTRWRRLAGQSPASIAMPGAGV